MEVANRVESRSEYLAFEAFVGARKLIEEIMCVKADEDVLITTDTSSDMRVAELLAGHPGAKLVADWQTPPDSPVREFFYGAAVKKS